MCQLPESSLDNDMDPIGEKQKHNSGRANHCSPNPKLNSTSNTDGIPSQQQIMSSPFSSPSSSSANMTAFKNNNNNNNHNNGKNHQHTTTPLHTAQENLRLGTLYGSLSLALLIFSVSLTMPHYQSLRDELQCNSFCYGSLTSARSALQLVGAALVGRLSDVNYTPAGTKTAKSHNQNHNHHAFMMMFDRGIRNGRKACLYLGITATVISFLIAIFVKSIRGMWASMIPSSLLQQNFGVLKALLADYHGAVEDASIMKTATATGLKASACDSDDDDHDDDKDVMVMGEDKTREHNISSRMNKINNEPSINKNNNKKKKEEDKDHALKADLASARAGSVGKLGMAVGLAFMMGPLIGATIVSTYEQANFVAVAVTLASAFLVAKLPNVTMNDTTHSMGIKAKKEQEDDVAVSKKKKTGGILSFLNVRAARDPAAIFLMTIRTCMALAFHIFMTIWTVSLKDRFDFGPSDHGWFMSFIGLAYALSQGPVAKRITKSITTTTGRVRVVQLCCLALGLGRYFAFQTTNLVAVYVMFAFIVTSLGVLNTILTADTSNIAPSDEIGGLFGVLEAVERSAGMIGPVMGGTLSYLHPVTAPLLAVMGLYLFVFLLVSFWYEPLVLKKKVYNGDRREKMNIPIPSSSSQQQQHIKSQ